MIVKNELGGIDDTMNSVLPFVDTVTVLDTGSTDGTAERIEALLAQHNVTGTVHRGTFVDFSTTRNEALRLLAADAARDPAARRTEFVLMLNGDDTLVNGNDLRALLELHRDLCGPSEEMLLMSVDYEGHKVSWSERIMRATNHETRDWPDVRADWHYVGLTHEVYSHPVYTTDPSGSYGMVYSGRATSAQDRSPFRFHIYHTYVRDTPDKLEARAMKDVALLKRQLAANPEDERAMFYIAHSYDIAGKFELALYWHERRVRRVLALAAADKSGEFMLTDNGHEHCTCLLRIAKLRTFRMQTGETPDELIDYFVTAVHLCPNMVEARYYLAQVLFNLAVHATDTDGDDETARDMLAEALQYGAEGEELVRTGQGTMHVLENETVYKRLPQLMQQLRAKVASKPSLRRAARAPAISPRPLRVRLREDEGEPVETNVVPQAPQQQAHGGATKSKVKKSKNAKKKAQHERTFKDEL